jgi:hypothetical protein
MASAVAVTAARRLVGPTGPRARCVLARSAAAHATRRPPYGLVMAPPPADTLHHPVGAVRTRNGSAGSVRVSPRRAIPARVTPPHQARVRPPTRRCTTHQGRRSSPPRRVTPRATVAPSPTTPRARSPTSTTARPAGLTTATPTRVTAAPPAEPSRASSARAPIPRATWSATPTTHHLAKIRKEWLPPRHGPLADVHQRLREVGRRYLVGR